MKISHSFPLLVSFLLGASRAGVHADAVHLQIVGPDKKPLAGARVRILETSGSWAQRKIEPLRDLTSDENGKVEFDSKNSLAAVPAEAQIDANLLMVRVLVPGMAVASRVIKAGDNEIVLQSGQQWGGVALDGNQKPVAGVKIALVGFGPDSEDEAATPDGERSVYLPKELQLETTTAGDGKWSFAGVPRVGNARISVVDPRFVREVLALPIKAEGAPPLFLERGAMIKGRLLAPDGGPAAGIRLYASGSGSFSLDDAPRTAPDGRFEIPGLRAGDYYLTNLNFGGEAKPLPFIIEQKNVANLRSGETREIGDWKALTGVVVKGQVIESGTKKPVPGASVSLWGNGNNQGQADDGGHFSFRAGEDVSQSSVSARGFAPSSKPVPAALKGVIDLGTIELKRGVEVSGTLKNEAGKNVASRQITAQETRSRSQHYGYVRDGKFTFDGLPEGDYTLQIEGMKLVSNPNFSVAANQKTAPLQVVVALEIAETPQVLAGRALDGGGKAVAGARIALRISDGNRSYQNLTTISGLDGVFNARFSMSGATPKVSSAVRPGLLFSGSGDFKIVDGAWRADLVFGERGAALRGRVIDSQGQPAARVFVSLAGRGDQTIVQSDEAGVFSLPDVALQGVTVVASNGREWGEFAIAKAGEKVEVRLQKTADYDRTALADEILPDARLGNLWGERWDGVWETLGASRLEAAILRARNSKGNGLSWEWTWNEYLRRLARRDAASLVARGDELIALAPKNSFDAPALLSALRARSGVAAEREKARVWLETQGKTTRALDGDAVKELLGLAVVAENLRKGDGFKWVEFAAQIAAQLSAKARISGAQEWSQQAASISPLALENLVAEWEPKARLGAFHGALAAAIEAGDPAAARAMLQAMEEVLPAAQADQNKVLVENYEQKPRDIVAQARGELATWLSQTDPGAALKLAPEVSEYERTQLLLVIGKNAAKLGQKELAAQALRQVFEAKFSNVEPGAAAAQIALGFDPKLADELFERVWQKSKPRSGDDDFDYRPSIAAYASARAQGWAGESRILIEREWAERLKSYKAPTDNNFDSSIESLQDLIGTMAKLDARRALEMAALLPGKDEARAIARGQIAIALLEKP